MKLFRTLSIIVVAVSAALAQTQPAPLHQNWYPQEIEAFGQNATSRTEFSFDHSMLVMKAKMDQDDDSFMRVIAGIDGISVHRFKFQGPGMFDPRIMGDIRHEYNMAGWQHIGNAHDKYGYPQGADVWIHLEHNTIRNIAVLFSAASQINFLSISGSISPIDLLHLSGHLGIPSMQGGVVVRSPRNGPPPTPPSTAPNDGDQQAPPPDPSN
jgi:hypothetical protein